MPQVTRERGRQEEIEEPSQDQAARVGSAATAAAVTAEAEKTVEDIDALLDEMDKTLETNAEEFVAGFIQKGGE